MRKYEKVKRTAVKAAVEAGRYALKHTGLIRKVSYKKGINNLVTDVDKKCEKMIINRIKKEFPSHSIIAEESGNDFRDAGHKWIIDPLDGTVNYTHAFPFFCVSIGYAEGGKVKYGVVYDPTRNELFTAAEACGAFLNKKRIRVSRRRKLSDSLVVTGFAYSKKGKVSNIRHFRKMLNAAQAVRRDGSAAIDLCYVACGRFDAFWEIGLSPWDTAAAQLIVKEAGGKISLINGKEFDIFKKEIVATNGYVHKETLRTLGGQ